MTRHGAQRSWRVHSPRVDDDGLPGPSTLFLRVKVGVESVKTFLKK
jgi:hypothetical protein